MLPEGALRLLDVRKREEHLLPRRISGYFCVHCCFNVDIDNDNRSHRPQSWWYSLQQESSLSELEEYKLHHTSHITKRWCPSLPHSEFVIVWSQEGPEQLLFLWAMPHLCHTYIFARFKKEALEMTKFLNILDNLLKANPPNSLCDAPFLIFVHTNRPSLLIVTQVIINPLLLFV